MQRFGLIRLLAEIVLIRTAGLRLCEATRHSRNASDDLVRRLHH